MNRLEFSQVFEAALALLAGAEKITKQQVSELSRSLLVSLHASDDELLKGDIGFVNRFLQALTPVNQKVGVLFFQEFTGFVSAEQENGPALFKNKNKAAVPGAGGTTFYQKASDAALEALKDPAFDLWVWAEREVKHEVKAYDLARITKFVDANLKKAIKEGFTREDVLRAILSGGITPTEVVTVIDHLAAEEEAITAVRKAQLPAKEGAHPEPMNA